MDMDEDLDTHICLKCQTTIIGLENYIVHKRTQCPMMMAKFASEAVKVNTDEDGAVTVVTTVVSMPESLPDEQQQPSAALPEVTQAAVAPNQNEHLRPDDFFLSLELQSNKVTEKKSEPCKADTTSAAEIAVATDAVIAFGDVNCPPLSTEEIVPCQVVDDKMDEVFPCNANDDEMEEEEEDGEWPPEGHTGGKWKPGMRPGTLKWYTMRSRRKRKARTSTCRMVKGKKQRKAQQIVTEGCLSSSEDPSIKQSTKLWHCTPCNLTCVQENEFVSHLASPEHWMQGKTHPIHEQLILSYAQALAKFSPFQCYVCSFYFSRYEDFMQHWSKPQELHLEHLEQHKGFRCSICNVEYWTIDEIRLHLADVNHASGISNSGPLVVKSTDGFRCQQCDWFTMRNSSLQSHMKGRHHKLMALTCIVCVKSFPDQESLTNHLASKEHRANCHPCSLCPYLGKSLVDVASHTALVHYPSKKSDSNVHKDGVYPTTEASSNEYRIEEETAALTNVEDYRPQKQWRLRGRCRHCCYCDRVFYQHAELKAHIRDDHPENNFNCQACCVSFVYESQFKKHESTRLHKCCISDVSNGQLLEGDVEFYCRQCVFRSLTQVGILFHQAMHIGPSQSHSANRASDDEDDDDDGAGEAEDDADATEDKVDEQCATTNGTDEQTRTSAAEDDENDNSKENKDLQRTQKKAHKKYCCPVCHKYFTWIQLRVHLNKHTGDKPFVCTMCGMAYAQKTSLWSHIRSLHKEKVFACPQCPFRASRYHKLKLHLEIHKERERNFICEVCGAGFFRRYSLIHHEKLHNGEKNQKCNFPGCKKSFRCPSELVYHMRVHTGECPFLCDTCGYAAKTRHQLTKHERTHNGIRPFQCPHCSYSASLSPQLKRHMRIHSGSKPYSCPYCKYTCNTQENLRKHVLKSKKHQGLHVYVCPRCNFGCNWAKDMKKHMIAKHGDLAKEFDETSPAFSSTLTGVYNGECDKKMTGNPPIPYVPRTEKRALQQFKGPSVHIEEPHSNVIEKPQSNSDLTFPLPKEGNGDDSSVVIVTDSIDEPQLEIAAVESVKWINLEKTKGRAHRKQYANPTKTKISIAHRKKKVLRAIKQQQSGREADEITKLEPQDIVPEEEEEDRKDNTQLFHILHGDSAERQESEEIALYTIELPLVQQEDGDERAIMHAEEDTEEILSTVISDETESQDQLQNAIFIPLSSVLSASPSADGHALAFIQNPSDQVMVDAPLDENEQHTLTFIQNPEGEEVMTMENHNGETVILYTCLPIST